MYYCFDPPKLQDSLTVRSTAIGLNATGDRLNVHRCLLLSIHSSLNWKLPEITLPVKNLRTERINLQGLSSTDFPYSLTLVLGTVLFLSWISQDAKQFPVKSETCRQEGITKAASFSFPQNLPDLHFSTRHVCVGANCINSASIVYNTKSSNFY